MANVHKAAMKSPVTLLLESQHRKVETLFKKLGSPKTASKAVLDELANCLAAHMAIEQEIYYPVARKVKEDLVLESYEEHAIAELGLKRLLGTKQTNEHFEARVTAVKELIQHHVEEEEDDLFPAVDKKLDVATLASMAETMKARFDEVLRGGFEAAVPKGFAKTSADLDIA